MFARVAPIGRGLDGLHRLRHEDWKEEGADS